MLLNSEVPASARVNTSQGPTTNDRRLSPDVRYYILAAALGIFAGWVDVKVGDLLFTALLVLAPCILLGTLRPSRPWRWTVIVGVFVPIADVLAYLIMAQKPDRAQIYESFLAFLPGLVGAYGGAFMRGVINNLLSEDKT